MPGLSSTEHVNTYSTMEKHSYLSVRLGYQSNRSQSKVPGELKGLRIEQLSVGAGLRAQRRNDS